MDRLIESLEKRRKVAFIAVILLSLIALIINSTISVAPLNYFDGEYNLYGVYFLIIYKLIELPILYYLLMYRYIDKMYKFGEDSDFTKKVTKHTKLLLFLIPQGNVVFGIIAYKLSGDVMYFLTFSLIALITLSFLQIKKINTCSVTTQ